MQSLDTSFQDNPAAFYKNEDYLVKTKNDFKLDKALPPAITYRFNDQTSTSASIVGFPGIELHSLAGSLAFLPVSFTKNPFIKFPVGYHANAFRASIPLENNKGWKYKRICIEFDGYKIDTIIVGKDQTIGNGRWMIFCNGNG